MMWEKPAPKVTQVAAENSSLSSIFHGAEHIFGERTGQREAASGKVNRWRKVSLQIPLVHLWVD